MNKIAMRIGLATLVATVAYGTSRFYQSNAEQPELRVFTRYKISFERLEPASYGEASEYDFVSYLYSPLIDFNNEGQLTSGLAERFYWQGSDLVFKLRNDFKSSKGDLITPEDVVISFKRNYILKPTRAKEFFEEICQGKKITKIDDPCPGLVTEGNLLTIKFDKKKPLYADILTSSDFAIVPKKSIDRDTLKIKDFTNGTGPYAFTEVNAEKSFFRLRARKDHWLWKPEIPQKVLIKTYFAPDGREPDHETAYKYFEDGKFDFWPTYGIGAYGASGLDGKKGYDIFQSVPIATYALMFSDRAKAEFSVAERLAIAEILRQAFYKDRKNYQGKWGNKETNEFFPPVSDGCLTKEQKAKYEALLAEARNITTHRSPLLHVKSSYMQTVISYLKSTNGKLSYESDESYRVPPNDSFQKRFDGFFGIVQGASIEREDSMFWLRDSKLMPYGDDGNSKWVDNFLAEDSKEKRISLLKTLHYDLLVNGMIAPIESFGVGAIVRDPWKFRFSKLFGYNPLWQIEYHP